MGQDFGALRPRMIEAIGDRIYDDGWRASLTALLGLEWDPGAKANAKAGPLGMLPPAAEAAVILRLVLAEILEGRLAPAAIPDADALMTALRRALIIEQKAQRHIEDRHGAVPRALLRALAATRLGEEDIDSLVRAAKPGPSSERELRTVIVGSANVHVAAQAIVRLWNRELTRHPGAFLKDGGCLLHQALEEVGSEQMRPLPEIAERLEWYARVYDLLYRCETEDIWRWAYEQLAEGGKPGELEAELLCVDSLPIAPAAGSGVAKTPVKGS